MQFSGKNSGEGDLAAEKEMLLSHISDLERQIEVLKLLVRFLFVRFGHGSKN